jgi:hypothetical protein
MKRNTRTRLRTALLAPITVSCFSAATTGGDVQYYWACTAAGLFVVYYILKPYP